MDAVASIAWTRLDVPGQDECRLFRLADGWRLSGRAIFEEEGLPCDLSYSVDCDSRWHTLDARVSGRCRDAPVFLTIAHESGEWRLNDMIQPVEALDLDLAFTPATNLVALRRLALPVGEGADAPAAWFDRPGGGLRLLPQNYRRLSDSHYLYRAPSYQGTLTVTPDGFISDYPRFWKAV